VYQLGGLGKAVVHMARGVGKLVLAASRTHDVAAMASRAAANVGIG